MIRKHGPRPFVLFVLLLVVAALAPVAWAQPLPIAQQETAVSYDSELVSAPGSSAEPVVIYSQTATSAGAPWMRLRFSQVLLSGSVAVGDESFLRISSAADGAVQIMGPTRAPNGATAPPISTATRCWWSCSHIARKKNSEARVKLLRLVTRVLPLHEC